MFWRTAAPFGFPPPSSSAAVERLFARFRIAYAGASPPPPDAAPPDGPRAPEPDDRRRLALLDALLDSDQADVLNELKARSRPLLSLLSSPPVLARLLEYATGRAFDEPPIAVPEDEDDDDDDLERVRERIKRGERADTAKEGEGDAAVPEPQWDASRRHKFPSVCTELIALEDPVLLDTLASSPALLPFWNWIVGLRPAIRDPPPEAADPEEAEKLREDWDGKVKEESLWVSYWCRISGVLIGGRRGPDFLSLILPTLPNLLPSLMPLMPLFPPLPDLVTRLLASFPQSSPSHAQLLASLRAADFIPHLIAMMRPECGAESHAAASQLVLDMIGVAYGPSEPEGETVFGGGPLMKELKSEASVSVLVSHMLPPSTVSEAAAAIPAASYSSSLTNGINILIELIRRYSSDIEAAEVAHQQHHVSVSMDPGSNREHPISESQLRDLATDLDGLLRVVSRHVDEWAAVLEHGMRIPLPPASPGAEVAPSGPALGAERLRVCELFAEVLHLQYLYASSPLFEVLVEGSAFPDGGAAPAEGSSVIHELHSLSRAVAGRHVLPRCIALFFLHPWNNFLHSVVYDMVAKVFNTYAYVAGVVGGTMGPGTEAEAQGRNEGVDARMRRMRDGVLELVESIVEEGRLMERIVDAQRKNDEAVWVPCRLPVVPNRADRTVFSSKPKGTRLGYMGHLTHVADECLKLWEKCSPDLPDALHPRFLDPAWATYADGPLRETRERDRQPLGGARPNPMAIGLGMGDGEGGNGVTVAFGNATLDPGADGDLRGWGGAGGVVGVGSVGDEEDGEDGGASKFAAYLSQKAGTLPGPIAGNNDSDDDDSDSEGREEGDHEDGEGGELREDEIAAEGSAVVGGPSFVPLIVPPYQAEAKPLPPDSLSPSSPPSGSRVDIRRSNSHGLDDWDDNPNNLSVPVMDDPDYSRGENMFADFPAAPVGEAADPLAAVAGRISGPGSPVPAPADGADWAEFGAGGAPR
ncbi:SIT4 phosphatase-associated protein-domain-containing protein [Hyaloraphidium curvatum]|nr:SIT4 phosphatase-associated protein-domain-containing protein [Hyaloraphidium curvatum]